jgi:hypothetical protein
MNIIQDTRKRLARAFSTGILYCIDARVEPRTIQKMIDRLIGENYGGFKALSGPMSELKVAMSGSRQKIFGLLLSNNP